MPITQYEREKIVFVNEAYHILSPAWKMLVKNLVISQCPGWASESKVASLSAYYELRKYSPLARFWEDEFGYQLWDLISCRRYGDTKQAIHAIASKSNCSSAGSKLHSAFIHDARTVASTWSVAAIRNADPKSGRLTPPSQGNNPNYRSLSKWLAECNTEYGVDNMLYTLRAGIAEEDVLGRPVQELWNALR